MEQLLASAEATAELPAEQVDGAIGRQQTNLTQEGPAFGISVAHQDRGDWAAAVAQLSLMDPGAAGSMLLPVGGRCDSTHT
eukprot:COSAG01_NODE_3559_length_5935_cov_2.330535_10_plen_81_part_00